MTSRETLSEAMKRGAPTTDTRTPKKSGRTERVRESCPHCGSRAPHGERIGCCSECKRLFTSMTAFEKHRRVIYCVDPETVGLEQKTIKSDPSVPGWGFPKGDVVWEDGYHE